MEQRRIWQTSPELYLTCMHAIRCLCIFFFKDLFLIRHILRGKSKPVGYGSVNDQCSFHLTRAPSKAQYKDPAASVWPHLCSEVYRGHPGSGTAHLPMEDKRRRVDWGWSAEEYHQFWDPWEVLLQADQQCVECQQSQRVCGQSFQWRYVSSRRRFKHEGSYQTNSDHLLCVCN